MGFDQIQFAKAVACAWVLLWSPVSALASTYFVAPGGSDGSPGNSNAPFATIRRAQQAASSGDTVYLRGGTYFLNNAHLTATNNPWAIVNNLTKSGIS